MNKTEPIEKAKTLLQHAPTCQEINNHPILRLVTKIKTTLTRLQAISEINKDKRWRIQADGSDITRFYGLPKIDEGVSLGPIVSLLGMSTCNLIATEASHHRT